ncbi:MAG TPA: protein kinase [Terriglobia bacterium]|nr:protein kinase [Terriglobia bacterium]
MFRDYNRPRMGTQTFSGYELLEVLGEGPRGTVYKAHDPKSGRWVAVKLFHSLEFENAEKLHGLKHPHVADVCDGGRAESQSFIVTEYLSGGTLKDHIRSLQSVGDAFPADQILAYAEQIAGALMYAHGQGICHGDLKAENVLFSEAGILKLTDFSPRSDPSFEREQRSDLDGLGNLLYELATGQAPFPGVAITPIEMFRNDLPALFAQVVSRLLDRERHDHYEDSRSVVADLKSISRQQMETRVRLPVPAGVSGTPPPPALSAGRLLAGRFRIVKFIARGGMGDVYEAEDLELREHVALKTVRSEFAGSEPAMARFKREVHLARRVTHPNVCRIFDLFHDVVGSEKITFLTMELLKGETLGQHLLSTGRLNPDEALPIIRQMAVGLAAAHRAGVIHRDFKSSNVMLIPADADGRELRAVITDFGLARPAPAQELMATLSNPADVLGTPAYMAPEQLEHGKITSATDTYAFGLVMYEMVAGTLPFAGESGLAAALKRLQGPPPSPRVHAPELDTNWEATILQCLALDPAARFNNLDDVVKTLTGETKITPPVPAQRTRRFAPAIGVVLLLALLAGALAIRNIGNRAGFQSRPSIAVLGFKNLTGKDDAAWLSTALAEMLTTELAAGEKLRTIPGENVARMSVELALPEYSSFASDTLARVRNYLGADVIVYGSYVLLNGTPTRIRMDLRVQDSVHGNLLATISEEGYSADLLAVVSRSGTALREKLGVGKLEPGATEMAHAALPATPDAARFYADGLEKLRVFDALGARIAFEKAIAEDGRNALAHAALATAWSMLGYPMKASEQSKIALDLSSKLAREDQLLVEGRSREAALEWGQAAEVYRTLFGFFPDNIDYGLRLAGALTSAGEAKDGQATIEKLRKFPAPDRDNPRIDVAEARIAGALSDFRRQQAIAARAAAKGKERGAMLLVAGAKLIEGSALANLGELSRARTVFEEAREMYIAAGDRWDAANASTNLAYVAMQSGDFTQAENVYRQSLGTYRELGDRKGAATALTSIGTVFRNRGDFRNAKAMHEQALAIRREIGDRAGEAMSCNNLANMLSLMGDPQGAREMYQAALPVFREIQDRNAVATVLNNLGDLVSEEGDLSRAHDLYEESRATFQDLGSKSSLAHSLSRLGDLDLIDGDLVSARQRYEQALALRKQLGEKGGVGESQLALAQTSLHEGDAASAETAAKAASDEFRLANRPNDEASAMAVLARSLFDREEYAGSTEAIQRAEDLSAKSSDRSVRLSVAITGASIRAAQGDTAKSLKDLELVVREARNARLIQLELEARLALAAIEVATGRLQAGRLRLEALETEALKKGYKYIADRAAAARKKIPIITAQNENRMTA